MRRRVRGSPRSPGQRNYKAKGSLQTPKAAGQRPLPSHSASRAQTSARQKLGSSEAEVKRKEEAACEIWRGKKTKPNKPNQIMSNYAFTMPVKEANISHAEVASLRVALDEISSKTVHFLLKCKA